MSALISELAAAKTCVFLDIEDCKIHNGLSVVNVTQNIRTALANMGYHGEVSIEAYGNTKDHDFHSAGIKLNRFPKGDKDKRLEIILVDSFFWAVDNPEQSNVMLIVGDISEERGIIKSLRHLKLKNYNLLLAQPRNASGELLSIVSSVWFWSSLSAGGSPIDQSGSSGRKQSK